MRSKILITSAACLFAFLSLEGCGNTDSASSVSTSATTSAVTTEETTTTQEETTETITETAEPTTETETTITETETVPETTLDPSTISAPFGDISNAYVCIGGTELYPNVYVLTKDEVKEMAAQINSAKWEEAAVDPIRPQVGGPYDLYMYIYDNGKCSQLGLGDYAYEDGNTVKYYQAFISESESFSVHEIVSPLIGADPSRIVATHLEEAKNFDRNSTMQDYWDLIWQDVIPFIEGSSE